MGDFSIAEILSRGYNAKKDQLSQPYGLSNLAPVAGNLAQAGIQSLDERQKRQSVLQAQQDYAKYMTNPNDPAMSQRGIQAGLSLGITPQAPPSQAGTVDPGLYAALAKHAGVSTTSKPTKENVAAMENLEKYNTADKDAAKAKALSTKQAATDEKFWSSQLKEFNPNNTRRGTLLGQAALGNSRADRALLEIQKNPTSITPQLKALITQDLAGIMQGGTPHEEAIRAAGYDTLKDKWANLVTKVTGNPSKAEVPGIIAELKNVISTIKTVDNRIISSNADFFETANSEAISRNPEKWKKLKSLINSSTVAPGDTAPDYPAPKGGSKGGGNSDPMGLGI